METFYWRTHGEGIDARFERSIFIESFLLFAAFVFAFAFAWTRKIVKQTRSAFLFVSACVRDIGAVGDGRKTRLTQQ